MRSRWGKGKAPEVSSQGWCGVVGWWLVFGAPASVGAVNCGGWHLLINFFIFSVTSDDNGGNRHAKR